MFNNKEIFVGGIPLSIDQDELYEYFQNFGVVTDCYIQRHKKSRLSRGYGFITFMYPEDAMACIEYNNHSINGRNISCNYGKSKAEAINDVFIKQRNKLFIGGVGADISEEQLYNCFSKFGKIEKIYLIYDKVTGFSKGFGFLEYEDETSAKRVASAHYIILNGCKIEIKPKLLKKEVNKDDANSANNKNEQKNNNEKHDLKKSHLDKKNLNKIFIPDESIISKVDSIEVKPDLLVTHNRLLQRNHFKDKERSNIKENRSHSLANLSTGEEFSGPSQSPSINYKTISNQGKYQKEEEADDKIIELTKFPFLTKSKYSVKQQVDHNLNDLNSDSNLFDKKLSDSNNKDSKDDNNTLTNAITNNKNLSKGGKTQNKTFKKKRTSLLQQQESNNNNIKKNEKSAVVDDSSDYILPYENIQVNITNSTNWVNPTATPPNYANVGNNNNSNDYKNQKFQQKQSLQSQRNMYMNNPQNQQQQQQQNGLHCPYKHLMNNPKQYHPNNQQVNYQQLQQQHYFEENLSIDYSRKSSQNLHPHQQEQHLFDQFNYQQSMKLSQDQKRYELLLDQEFHIQLQQKQEYQKQVLRQDFLKQQQLLQTKHNYHQKFQIQEQLHCKQRQLQQQQQDQQNQNFSTWYNNKYPLLPESHHNYLNLLDEDYQNEKSNYSNFFYNNNAADNNNSNKKANIDNYSKNYNVNNNLNNEQLQNNSYNDKNSYNSSQQQNRNSGNLQRDLFDYDIKNWYESHPIDDNNNNYDNSEYGLTSGSLQINKKFPKKSNFIDHNDDSDMAYAQYFKNNCEEYSHFNLPNNKKFD